MNNRFFFLERKDKNFVKIILPEDKKKNKFIINLCVIRTRRGENHFFGQATKLCFYKHSFLFNI